MVKLIYRSVLITGPRLVTGPPTVTLSRVTCRGVRRRCGSQTCRRCCFFENTGKFSPDVFTNQGNLWNTTIEGASREGASESMLVVVEIRSEGEGWLPRNRKVQLTARYRIADRSGYGKPAFFSKTMTINIGTDDKFFAAFWLYDTGCHPVELTARIVGQKGSLRRKINLGCGE